MVPLAVVALVLSFIGVGVANGQGLRGSGHGSRGFGVARQPGRTSIQTIPGRGTIQTAPALRASPGPFAPSGRGFIPPPGVQMHKGLPVFVPPLAPQPHFRPPPFHPHPGILIIDVPGFYDTTVITQTVPQVAGNDRRPAETPPSDLRTRTPGQWAPFDPTPQEVVDRMLALASVKSSDLLYDLGAGDGRIVISAAKKYGAKAVGFEIDPGLVKLARENARKQGVEHLVEIRQQDFLTADLSPASVVTLYLSYDGNLAVRSQLMSQLRPGARVVSYTFDMGSWQPKIAESYRDVGGAAHMLYLWEIGAPVVFSDSWR